MLTAAIVMFWNQ